jgi:hypothetical protein
VLENLDRRGIVLARPIVLIPHLFQLADAFNFRKDYSPPLVCHLDPTLGLNQRLPKLKFEKDLVYHPCRHGKMVAASHPPVNQVMTKGPASLFIWTRLVQLGSIQRVGSGMF